MMKQGTSKDRDIERKAKVLAKFCQRFWQRKSGYVEPRYTWQNMSENNKEIFLLIAERFME
jgi:hypothetical protein